MLFDHVTKNRLFGHYARILVDLDLSKYIFYEVMVERKGFAFLVSIEYERLLHFCTHYKSIGHNVNSYCWLHPRKEDKQADNVDNGKKPVNSQKHRTEWKPKDTLDGVGSLVAFETHHPKEVKQKEPLIDETQHEGNEVIPEKVPNF